MAKKKKTQLKPVARGFATTSVPKKVIQPEEVLTEDASVATVEEVQLKTVADQPGHESAPALEAADEFDPDKVEEQSLQNLVDKLQDKTEKEVTRVVKAIEQDRRYSKALPFLDMDPNIRERIISLAVECGVYEGFKPLDESEDKIIARLAITYGVLRRIGFSENRVEECLRAINGVELEEAYDWLYTHCTEEELGERGSSEGAEPRTPRTPRTPADRAPRTPKTPRTPAQFLATSVPASAIKSTSRLDANAPAFIPSRIAQVEQPSEYDSEDQEHADMKARTLASLGSQESQDEFGLEPREMDDPTSEYVQLKLKHDELTSGLRSEFTTCQLKRLRMRLENIKKDYFFDEQEAEGLYRAESAKIKALALHQKLSSPMPSSPKVSTPPQPAKKRPPNLKPPLLATTVAAPDLFADSDDDDDNGSPVGGVLALLDDIPQETNSQGTLISVRDMALPKHWSGRTPKILLKETVAKSDRYAAVSYAIISGSSRAKRASVSIRWENRKTDEWAMEDVACPDELQAEQYIATIALHALTFPSTDGIATSLSTSGSQTFFRLLPAVFRDLWDELEASRKTRDDAIKRTFWAKLRNIIEQKLEANPKVNSKLLKQAGDKPDFIPPRPSIYNSDNFSEQLETAFRARQATPAYQEMLVQRNQLPIARYREEIIQTLDQSQILVLSGETGCGKSTQVPAFILEDQLSRGKPCKIYCTEPRRISAISLAQRVSRELGDSPNAVGTLSSLVGYSIRLESNISRNTRLAFVTNGIALRMLEGGSGQGGQGTAFDEITHIVIDEVHERTIESDFLLIVLKSLLEQRSDLKVILMSATLDAEKISEYFGGCPTLHVPGRTFPVDVRYLEDAVEYTKWSVSEGSPYARRLHDKFYKGKSRTDWSEEMPGDDDSDDSMNKENVKLEKLYSPETATTLNTFDERLIPYELIIRLLEKICFEDQSYASYSPAILVFMPGLGEIRRLNDLLAEHLSFGSGNEFRVYPLHSTLSSESQSVVFDIPPPGVRKIVIATNIAETGITIPDITCVIDTGKHREMRFDEKRQISRLVETFVAKSNAAQRRGRAGRVQRGLCFHLFTKLRHDTLMADSPLPEMMRLSLSDLALRIKIMKVKMGSSIEDVLSRAMDPPAPINVQRAISMLVEVRALTTSEEITPMGKLLSALPTDVHLGKFLLIAVMFRCLDPALTIAAALNSKSPFVSPLGLEQEADRAKASFRTENSDFLTIHNAFSSWRRASANPSSVRKFCRVNYLSHQNLQQIEELRQQFLGYLVDSSFIQVDKGFIRELGRARFGRNRSRFVSVPPEFDYNSRNPALVNAALTAGLYPKILAIDTANGQMRTITNNQLASFHPSSINFGRKPADFGVNHLAYFTLMHSKKLYAWETGPVDDMAMLLLCGECEFKLIADTALIDRKIRFRVPPKTNIALKFLRTQMANLLAHQFRAKPLTEQHVLWNEIGMMVLGKLKPSSEDQPPVVIVS